MKYRTEKQWYASKEHFNTELSWEEYKEKQKKKPKSIFGLSLVRR